MVFLILLIGLVIMISAAVAALYFYLQERETDD